MRRHLDPRAVDQHRHDPTPSRQLEQLRNQMDLSLDVDLFVRDTTLRKIAFERVTVRTIRLYPQRDRHAGSGGGSRQTTHGRVEHAHFDAVS